MRFSSFSATSISAISTALFALAASPLLAQTAVDNAALFGARPAVSHASLSPDGNQIAFIAPAAGQGSALFVSETNESATPKRLYQVDGKPERLSKCQWVSNSRITCSLWGVANDGSGIVVFSRVVAFNSDGSNPKMLSDRTSGLYGGSIIDWLPESADEVIMEKGDGNAGLAAVRINTQTLKDSYLERPDRNNVEFITDGHGNVRIKGVSQRRGDGYSTGLYNYYYRAAAGGAWARLGDYDSVTRTGFNPYSVDPKLNVVYGLDKLNGRLALYKYALDSGLERSLVLSRPDVDVDGLVLLGRHKRPIGASFAAEKREVSYFDPEFTKLHAGLMKAIPGQPLVDFADATIDEKKLLIWAGADTSPGTYYLLDRTSKRMAPLLAVRPELEGRTLAAMKSITYASSDGANIPGYLTLPPGSDGRNLPTIVMPHGGPSARDEWGFDWLVQYYAAQGYAVLQPNYRGSEGYGDSWMNGNAFQSWKQAIGDVNDAGRWLVKQGIADPNKLAIVGWSYGGYAALQSAVVDPTLWKAVVAIAPVTDLDKLREQSRRWSNRTLSSEFIGSRANAEEASPARHAGQIKAPVLLFHGAMDRNVDIGHSELMESRLKAAGAQSRLVTWQGLDHYLEDSEARTRLLRESDQWLKAAFGR